MEVTAAFVRSSICDLFELRRHGVAEVRFAGASMTN